MDFNVTDLIFIIPLIIMVAVVIKLLMAMHENKKYWDDVGNSKDDLDISNEISKDDTPLSEYDIRVQEMVKKSLEDPNFDLEKAILEDLEKTKQEEDKKNP